MTGARGRLKTANAKTQEQARLQVEEAEDKLVQMTETAIGLMKAVLENVGPRPSSLESQSTDQRAPKR